MAHVDVPGLIARIEDAALDERRWPDILRGIADLTGSHNSALVRQDRATGRADAMAVGLDPAAQGLFVAYYAQRNILIAHSEIDEAFGRRAVTVRSAVREVLHRSEYYNDFLLPFDVGELAWMFLDRDRDDFTNLVVGRPRRLGRYETPELHLLTAVMPHAMRAYGVARRLGGIGAVDGTLERYLNMLPQGVILLDAMGHTLHANRAAEAISAANDGLAFRREGPAAQDSRASTQLRKAIAAAQRHGRELARSHTLCVPRPSGAPPYAVAVCPFGEDRGSWLFRRPSVLVEVRDLAAETPDSAWLAGCFGLTPAEARVASLLLSGLDRAAIARELGIAGNTVRVHLARLMNKTETHRQTELVQLLGRVAALRRNS